MTKLIIDELIRRGETISFAESCTGGRIVSLFTSIPGVPDVFCGSCITYSDDIKHKWLGVEEEILSRYGAVSKECVEQMLMGISQISNSNHAIAVSGIAGPTGGSSIKPVGTVYIGILIGGKMKIQRYHFDGDRVSIQSGATKEAITFFAQNYINI